MATALEEKLNLILQEKTNKIIPENIKKDVTILGVTGTYEGSGSGETTVEGIKQFASVEEMNNSTGNKEGDLAIVYSSTISNITADSQFQTAKVPSTVVLPEAFTDYVNVRFQAVDSSQMFECLGQLDSSMFMMSCYTESGEVRIQYESSDGITYTRTDGGEEIVDFGTVIQFGGTWNDVIGYFIQSGSNYFGGLFKHKLVQDTSKINFISNVKLNNTITYDIVTDDYLTITEGLRIVEAITEHFGKIGHLTIIKQNNIITAYVHAIATGALTIDDIMLYNNKIYVGLYTTAIGNMTGSYKIIFSEDLSTYTVENLTATQLSGNYYSYEEIPVNSKITGLESNGKYHCGLDFYDVSTTTRTSISFGFGKKGVYEVAPTQLSADSNYVYEKEFYGKNGVETGALQNIENLAKEQIKTKIELWNIFNTGIVCPENMSNAFNGCTDLIEIPTLDTSKVTNMDYMFLDCKSLVEVPLLDTSNVTTMSYMFRNCALITLPSFNTSNVTVMNNAFISCSSLVNVPLLNTSKVTNMNNAFFGCTSLSEDSLNNILLMCANTSSNYSLSKTLKGIGLTSAQATKCQSLSNYSAFTAAGWKTGY